jgi:uncharacterized protein YbjT (DUF2867 family)
MSEPEAKIDLAAPAPSEAVPVSPAPQTDAAPKEEPAHTCPGTSVLAALIGEWHACRGAARALANQDARVRVLCADKTEVDAIRSGLREGAGALSDERLALVSFLTGRVESDSDLGNLLEGATGVALLSPVGPEGRTWRAATHTEDVRSVLESVTNRRIPRLAYLSSVNASFKLPVRCLREAAEAEKLIEKVGCLDFLLRTGPVIGRGDSWLTMIMRKASAANPFAVVRGYGDTPFQPIHEDDLGACIARCFIAPANDLHAGVYSLYSTPSTSVVDLLERTAKHLSRWPKVRLHIPLFVILLGARLRRLTDRNRAWESADRLGLLRCGLVAERNDLETLMGPACSTRPLANALDEAAMALGLSRA